MEADPEQRLPADLQTLRQIAEDLDQLEERLNVSPIPRAVTQRGYFTPDEDDRIRQGVLLYRNCRLAAYDIILRYRDYASPEAGPHCIECFLVAFGAALILYAKSLRIIAFAEHEPMLRAKLNEPDVKHDMEAGFFDDVLAGYSRLCNYRSMLQADAFWRAHRREGFSFARTAGGDWAWLADLIRHQRHNVRNRLLHVLWQRLRYDRRAFGRTMLSPFRRARHGLEALLSGRLEDAETGAQPIHSITAETVAELYPRLKPGDILLVRDDTRLAAAILPGFWTHAALFLGGCADLEAMGLRPHPYITRHWHQLQEKPAAMGLVIEALAPCVQLNPLEKCLRVDHLVVLRPAALPEAEVAAAIGEAIGQLGKPYDFEFDFNKSSRIVCTELVYRSYHKRGSISFTLTKRLGRFTLTGDDIITHVLHEVEQPERLKALPLEPVALLLTRRGGRLHAATRERIIPLLRRLQRGWRPTRTRIRKL